MASPSIVKTGAWLSESWKFFTSAWQAWMLLALAVFSPMLPGLVGLFAVYFGLAIADASKSLNDEVAIGLLGGMGVSFLLLFAGGILTTWFAIGLWRAAIGQMRGEKPSLAYLKGNGRWFWRVVGANLVIGFLTQLGMMLCYIPGFIVLGWFQFAMPLIIEKDLSIGEAMRQSKAMADRDLLAFTIHAFALGIIVGIGSYACGVGILATMPLWFIAGAIAYRDCFGIEGAAPPAVSPAPPVTGAPMPPPAPAGWQP